VDPEKILMRKNIKKSNPPKPDVKALSPDAKLSAIYLFVLGAFTRLFTCCFTYI